jgi:hypothetical protein
LEEELTKAKEQLNEQQTREKNHLAELERKYVEQVS